MSQILLRAFWWISFHPVKQYYLGIVVTPRYFLKLGLNVLNAVLLTGVFLMLSDCHCSPERLFLELIKSLFYFYLLLPYFKIQSHS